MKLNLAVHFKVKMKLCMSDIVLYMTIKLHDCSISGDGKGDIREVNDLQSHSCRLFMRNQTEEISEEKGLSR